MKKLDNSKKDVLVSIVTTFVLFLLIGLASCSSDTVIEDTDPLVEASIESANFESFTVRVADLKRAEYDFKNTPKIQVERYNDAFTYELKLTGRYFGEEYILSLTAEEASTIGETNKKVTPIESVTPEEEVEETRVSLTANIDDLDLKVDDYIATIIEKESNTELSLGSADSLTDTEIEYETFVIDSNATNFLSGTQLESDDWAVLTELNLNNHVNFRVRPTIVNYLNGIGVVLGVYDLQATKIGFITSSGSNGSGAGTYSYKFRSSDVNDLITNDGTYLLRLEERTSTVDANDTGYRNGLFQEITITKTSGHLLSKK